MKHKTIVSIENIDEVKSYIDSEKIENTQDSRDNELVVSGPLSEVYTKALDIVYAKDTEIKNKLSVESQAIDAAIAQAVTAATTVDPKMVSEDSEKEALSDRPVFVYTAGVQQLNNAQALAAANDLAKYADKADVVVVIDDVADRLRASTEGFVGFRSTAQWVRLKSACESSGVSLCGSMEEFLRVCLGK